MARRIWLLLAAVDSVIFRRLPSESAEDHVGWLAPACGRKTGEIRRSGIMAGIGIVNGWIWDQRYLEMVREELATGQHRRPSGWPVFTTAYFHDPEGTRQRIARSGTPTRDDSGDSGSGVARTRIRVDASRHAKVADACSDGWTGRKRSSAESSHARARAQSCRLAFSHWAAHTA